MRKAHAISAPILGRAMRVRAVTIDIAVAALVGTVALFGRIGAEFIPQLDEGDVLARCEGSQESR